MRSPRLATNCWYSDQLIRIAATEPSGKDLMGALAEPFRRKIAIIFLHQSRPTSLIIGRMNSGSTAENLKTYSKAQRVSNDKHQPRAWSEAEDVAESASAGYACYAPCGRMRRFSLSRTENAATSSVPWSRNTSTASSAFSSAATPERRSRSTPDDA